jgi:hypothetical protein
MPAVKPRVRFIIRPRRHASIIAFVLTVSLVVPHTTSAQAICNKEIYFGNGVFTEFSDAWLSAGAIQDALGEQLDPAEFAALGFSVAYNPSAGFLVDFVESVLQALGSDLRRFWRPLFGLEEWSDVLQAYLEEVLGSLELSELADQVVDNHVDAYKRSMAVGRSVIVVTHSQGNFFANTAWGQLTTAERKGFRIVASAVPDTFVAGGGPYTTLSLDLVIALVRKAKERVGLPQPLPANVSTEVVDLWTLNHGFRSSYLAAGTSGQQQIVSGVRDAIGELKNACQPLLGPELTTNACITSAATGLTYYGTTGTLEVTYTNRCSAGGGFGLIFPNVQGVRLPSPSFQWSTTSSSVPCLEGFPSTCRGETRTVRGTFTVSPFAPLPQFAGVGVGCSCFGIGCGDNGYVCAASFVSQFGGTKP